MCVSGDCQRFVVLDFGFGVQISALDDDNPLTFMRPSFDTRLYRLRETRLMSGVSLVQKSTIRKVLASVTLAAPFQDLPLISGAVDLVTGAKGGRTTDLPVLAQVRAASIGNPVLVENRELSSADIRSFWQTGITYRFLIPTWRAR
jgi:hypothetical protein